MPSIALARPHRAQCTSPAFLGQSACSSPRRCALTRGAGTLASKATNPPNQMYCSQRRPRCRTRSRSAAYHVARKAALLQKPVLDCSDRPVHTRSTRHPRQTIANLGGKAVSANDTYTFPTDQLKHRPSRASGCRGPSRRAAVSAYLGAGAVSATRTSPRPRRAFSATRQCTGSSCALRLRNDARAIFIHVLRIRGVAPSICRRHSGERRAAPPATPTAGEAIYRASALACHALAYDRTGPRPLRLFVRTAGGAKGFAFRRR